MVEAEAGPWWATALVLLVGLALAVGARHVRGRTVRRALLVVGVLVAAAGALGTVLALAGPVRVG